MIARVYSQHLYATFILALATKTIKVCGKTEVRRFDQVDVENNNKQPLLNTVFRDMARFFVQSNLGSEEEAYACIIPAFANKMPSSLVE